MEREQIDLVEHLSVLFPAISRKNIVKYIRRTEGNGQLSKQELLAHTIDHIINLDQAGEFEGLIHGEKEGNNDVFEDDSNEDDGLRMLRDFDDDENDSSGNSKNNVDGATLRKQLELERNIGAVRNVFPDVDRQWIIKNLQSGCTTDVVVDFIISRPGEVPRIPKATKKEIVKVEKRKRRRSSANDENWSFYMLNNEMVSERYFQVAREVLLNDFLEIKEYSIVQLMEFFKGHYAPIFYVLSNLLKTDQAKHLPESRTVELKIDFGPDDGPDGRFFINFLRSKRLKNNRLKKILRSAPPELNAEIEWSKENFHKKNVKKRQSIVTPGRAARQRAEAEFECMICCDMYIIPDMVSCTDGHLFCADCLRNYAKEVVYGQAKVLLTCLNDECKCGFSRATLETAIDDDCLQKLDERLQMEDISLAGIQNLVRCKFCNFAAVIDVPIEENKVFKCESRSCGKSFCRLCEVDWDEHVGLKCEEVETSDETKKRKEIEEKMVNAIARECHRCKSKIIKEDGCNKMKCRCGSTLCYVCRAPNINYDHFCKHVRTPGKGCKVCRSCSLWEDTNKTIDVENLQTIAREAEQVLKKKI